MDQEYEYEYYTDDSYEFNPFNDKEDSYDHNLNASVPETHSHTSSPPVEISPVDNSIAFSTSLNQSKQFISQNLNLSPAQLRNSSFSGLIVLRLKDFALLRNDSRCNRQFPHLLILPGQNFPSEHPDYFSALNQLYAHQ